MMISVKLSSSQCSQKNVLKRYRRKYTSVAPHCAVNPQETTTHCSYFNRDGEKIQSTQTLHKSKFDLSDKIQIKRNKQQNPTGSEF